MKVIRPSVGPARISLLFRGNVATEALDERRHPGRFKASLRIYSGRLLEASPVRSTSDSHMSVSAEVERGNEAV